MYLILSDLHGNVDALNAILEKSRQDHNIIGYGILGDMFTLGPSPVEIFETLMGLENFFFIHGNHEDYLYDAIHKETHRQIGNFKVGSDLCRKIRSSLERTYHAMGQERLDRLKAITIDETDLVVNGIEHYFCHGREHSNQVGYSAVEAQEYLKDFDKDYFWAGHIHYQFMAECAQKYFVNPGGSGLPFDGDPAAPYAIIQADGHVKLDRASYPREPLYEKLDETDDEFIPILKKHLQAARLVRF